MLMVVIIWTSLPGRALNDERKARVGSVNPAMVGSRAPACKIPPVRHPRSMEDEAQGHKPGEGERQRGPGDGVPTG